MYYRRDGKHLPGRMLALGFLGLVLRQGLYMQATDEKGLLISGHPLAIVLWLLTAATAAYLVLSVWKLDGAREYEWNFMPSLAAAIGQCLAAAGFLATALLGGPVLPGFLGQGWKLLGILSGPCLAAAAFCRCRGKKPYFLLHLVPCLFLVLHIINHYQTWSNKPQLMDYAFSLFGAVALSLFAFYTAAYGADIQRRRMQIGTGLAAVYFSLVSLVPGDYPLLYLGGVAWALTGLATLTPKPQHQEIPEEGDSL